VCMIPHAHVLPIPVLLLLPPPLSSRSPYRHLADFLRSTATIMHNERYHIHQSMCETLLDSTVPGLRVVGESEDLSHLL